MPSAATPQEWPRTPHDGARGCYRLRRGRRNPYPPRVYGDPTFPLVSGSIGPITLYLTCMGTTNTAARAALALAAFMALAAIGSLPRLPQTTDLTTTTITIS